MKDGPNIANVASIVGERARAEILTSLLSGEAMTATELAMVVKLSKQTVSVHLAKLVEGGLLVVEAQGRHRYFRLADPDVVALLEALAGVAFRAGQVRLRSSPREPLLRHARVCYDHLAGDCGVAALDALLARGHLENRLALKVTESGRAWFDTIGIDVNKLQGQKRPVCKTCLDWSVRRHHLAGALGAALLSVYFSNGWAQRMPESRVVTFTRAGEKAFSAHFGIAPKRSSV
jgi:DNA-binding transcriptional ArsR family regulator